MNPRRMPLILALAAVFIVAALCWLVPLSKTSQAAPASSGEAAFKGKVLLINTSGMMRPSVFILDKAQVRKIGDQPCLVGKGAGDGPMLGWDKGRTVWLSMKHIVSITEFDDVKDASKAMKSGGPIIIGGGGYGAIQAVPAEAPLTPLPATTPARPQKLPRQKQP